MASGDPAPDSPEPVLGLAWMSFVDVGNSLSEIVLSSWAIVHSLESEDGLVGILGDLGSN